MVDPFRVAYIGQAISGLAILALGGLLLSARPRRRYLVSFGAFLGLWGGLIVLGNGATWALDIGHTSLAQRLILLHVAALALAYLPLAHFTLTYPTFEQDWLDRPWVVGLLVLPALVLGAAFLLDPGLLHQGFSAQGPRTGSLWGPLYPAFAVTFIGAILAAIVSLVARYERTEHTIERRRVLYVVLAFTLYVAFESGENVFFVVRVSEAGIAGLSDPLALGVAVSVIGGLSVVTWTTWRLCRGPGLPPDRRMGVLAFSTVVPLGFGLLSGLSLTYPGLPQILTLGVWRIGAAGLLVYAILRFELFGLERGVARTAAAGGLVAVTLGGLIIIQQLLAGLTGSQTVSAILVQGLVLGGLAVATLHRPGSIHALLEPLAASQPGDERTQRHLEVYEAALARATHQGAEAVADLDRLRDRLGISTQEHGLLVGLLVGDADAPVPEPGTVLGGRYRIEEPLAETTDARVLLAWDRLLDRQVVVKQLRALGPDREDVVRRFLHEARITAGIQHPNVVDVYDFGYAAGGPYLVMEHLSGGTLRARLRDGPPMDPREAVRVARDLLRGLDHLHEHGIIHRDLKPANVLLTADGVAKVADLGLAYPWEPEATQVLDDQPAGRAGTLAYMAPEVLRDLPPEPASDIYAAGAILYETINGHHPLGPDAPARPGLAQRVLSQPPQPPEGDVPEALQAVWEQALAKDPRERFGSAAKMGEALMAALPMADEGELGWPPERSAREV